MTTSMARHWRSMTQDSYMKEVFPEPPLTAFKKQANIKDHIIRAKVAPPKTSYPKRYLRGMKKCGKCTLCPYIKEGRKLKINGAEWNINKQLNCNSYNVIYAIFCLKEKCKQVYIGETKRMLRFRLADHRGYITNGDLTQATGAHFNMPGHSLADFSATIIEQSKKKNSEYRKERKHYFIRKFDTFHKGINRQR